jgi:hypothetical protein
LDLSVGSIRCIYPSDLSVGPAGHLGDAEKRATVWEEKSTLATKQLGEEKEGARLEQVTRVGNR